MNSNNQMIQKGKISSVEGKADRNGGNALNRRIHLTQFLQRIGQLVTVIVARAQHKLSI